MGKSIAELRAEGRVEGIAEGRAEGRVEGIAEGRAEVLKNLGISEQEYQNIIKNKLV